MNQRRRRPRRWARALGIFTCVFGVLLSLLAIGRVVRAPDPAGADGTRVALAQLARAEVPLRGSAARAR